MEIDLAEVCSGKFEKEAKNMQCKKKGRCFKYIYYRVEEGGPRTEGSTDRALK